METILLIDSDLGFVFWLGQILDRAGYDALPAKSVPDALALLAELPIHLDLLILDPYLPGAGSFVTTLRAAQPQLRVLNVTAAGSVPPDVGAVYRKPTQFLENTQAEWLQIVRNAFSHNASVT